MGKHFIFGFQEETAKESIEIVRKQKEVILNERILGRDRANEIIENQRYQLKATEGRVVVACNVEKKNWHTVDGSIKFRLEREYNNLNRRETQPVNATVIDGLGLPTGCEILIHHNSLHDVNRIFDFKSVSFESDTDVHFYSIMEAECFAWRIKGEPMQPMKGFALGLRVFEPYIGLLDGIESKKIKDVLYITSGELSGNVAHVLKASDYEIIFQGEDGKEDRVIRLRHSDTEEIDREEIIAIDHSLTEKVANGELLIGLSAETAKKIL